jgi:hypothetical protein
VHIRLFSVLLLHLIIEEAVVDWHIHATDGTHPAQQKSAGQPHNNCASLVLAMPCKQRHHHKAI